MRHLKAGKRLGVTTSHRKAMMRNLVTSLLEHGQIKTTLVRAKEMRKNIDKMIGYGKKGDLHARRLALKFVKTKDAMKRLFEEYGPLYQDRNGGYTRIYRLNNRLGDNSKMAIIQLVDLQEDVDTKVENKDDNRIKEVKSEIEAAETVAEKETEIEEEQQVAAGDTTADPQNETAENISQKESDEIEEKKESDKE